MLGTHTTKCAATKIVIISLYLMLYMYFVFVLQDKCIGAGTGMYKGKKLFYCKKDYALFVPLETVLQEKDFDAISCAEQNDQEKLCAQKVEQTLRNEAAAKSLVYDNSRTKGTFEVH